MIEKNIKRIQEINKELEDQWVLLETADTWDKIRIIAIKISDLNAEKHDLRRSN